MSCTFYTDKQPDLSMSCTFYTDKQPDLSMPCTFYTDKQPDLSMSYTFDTDKQPHGRCRRQSASARNPAARASVSSSVVTVETVVGTALRKSAP